LRIARAFEEPIVIILSWMILIIGILGAAKLIGAKLPTEGIMAGPGDLLRTA
jgi:hypothetical protein